MASFPSSTERLRFRTWQDGDLPLAVALWGDPDVTRLIDRREQLSEDDVRERVAREMEQQRARGHQYWPVFLRERADDDLDSFVGVAGLQPSPPLPAEERPLLELGFHLRKAFWGRGLAREAATAVIDHVFGVLDHGELLAGHHPDNKASRAVLEKLGFVFSHEAVFPPTQLQHPWYRLTAEAWQRRT